MTTVEEAAVHTTYIDAAAALHGLTVASEWRDGVAAHFAAIAAAARLVAAYPHDDEVEAAPIFTA